MAELDKFKRRVIRSVARKLIHEKKTEEELWQELKKETKCECKVLWERMRALTLKKLKRLLLAEDRLENIIPVAQMSLSDWLMFDLVLVHEDIDVIGRDIRGQESEIRTLEELLELINDFDIENKQGEALVAAWTQVTYTYNNRGRQCSPMMLQKRWYQIKKQIRHDFYRFWYEYRGNPKLLEKMNGSNSFPSEFEMKVAKRYPGIIVKRFLGWEKLIEEKYIILPEEFENKFRSQALAKSVTTIENEPDVVLLEPNIETIELADVEPDSENVAEKNIVTNNGSLDHSILSKKIVIKTEPTEEIDLENSANPEQLVKELHERDTKLLQSIPNIDEDDDDDVDDGDMVVDDAIVEGDVEKCAASNITNTTGSKEHISCNELTAAANNNSSEVSETIAEPVVMPQITNVFGNVNVDSEVLGEFNIGISTNIEEARKDITVHNSTVLDVDEQMDVDENPKNLLVSHNKADVVLNIPYEFGDKCNDKDKASQINQASTNVINSQITNPFMGIPTDLTFSDDGIELVDDGIEYDEEEDIITPFKQEDIKISRNYTSSSLESNSIKNEERESVEDIGSKFDLKLLMQFMVYTTKLDDMIVLKNSKYDRISDKQLIENILLESKPIRKIVTSVEIKREVFEHVNKDFKPVEANDNFYTDDESNIEGEVISEDKKVKPSSFLLQKPRSRTYNPIQLCKNPDFNTRLKRLTFGFLSSTRNRAMLKSLKPVTIDISKAFESKLFKGTLYLKPNDSIASVEKKVEANQQMTAVLPSAMPVQSLIDQIIPQHLLSDVNSNNVSPIPQQAVLPERKKNITLPDIENIRKMNQRLYIAEISPMRVLGPNENCRPPLHLVPNSLSDTNQYHKTADKFKAAEPNLQVNPKPVNINNIKQKSVPKVIKKANYHFKLQRYKNKQVEWSTASWVCKSANMKNEFNTCGDALITIDTLNKMFMVIKGTNATPEELSKLSKSERLAILKKEKLMNEPPKVFDKTKFVIDKITPKQENEKKELKKKQENDSNKQESKEKEETKQNKKTKNTKTKIRVLKCRSKIYCCWAREKLLQPRMRRRHEPPALCQCCCVNELAEHNLKTHIPYSITISDDEEHSSNNVTDMNEISEMTRQWSPIKLINETIPKMDKAPVTYDDTQTTSDKNIEISEEKEVAAKDHTETVNTTYSNQSSDDQLKQTINNAEIQPPAIKMPRIKVLPPSALSAPTIKPIGHGNQYIKLVPKTSTGPSKNVTGSPLIQNLKKPITLTNQMTGKSAKKILYLNSRNSGSSKGTPIYLGRNRILLTDGKIPDDLSTNLPDLPTSPKDTFQTQTENNVPNLVLPEGVQILLLPDGNISCTVDPTAKLDADKIAALPHILSAVQQQLAASKTPIVNIDLTKNNSEFVDLIDDEISDKNGNNAANSCDLSINNSITSSTKKLDTNDAVSTIGNPISLESENQLEQNIEINTSSLNANSQDQYSSNSIRVPSESNQYTESNTDKDLDSTVKALEQSSVLTSSSTVENKSVSDNISIQNNPENKDSDVIMGQNISKCSSVLDNSQGENALENKNSADDQTTSNSNRNTLLSDLMQMSGISMDDITPPTTENPHEVLPPSVLTPSIAQPASELPTSPAKQISELTSVSTFSQLKYACENKRKFFTLDLKTGAVSAINVCIQKSTIKRSKFIDASEKVVIDLTADQDYCDEVTVPHVSRSLLKSVMQHTPVQPLKLFKSVGVLNRKRNKTDKQNLNLIPQQHRGRRRKQPLDESNKEDIRQLTQVSESDSSDDEPLATKSKRMKCEDDQTQSSLENIAPTQLTTVKSIELEKNQTDNTDTFENVSQENRLLTQEKSEENKDLPQENYEQDEIEAEISFLCDENHSDDNDDCILGV